MYATCRQIGLGGTPSKTTLPQRLTKQLSANITSVCLIFHHHYMHRLVSGALEFVNDIVELLERDGGLAMTRPACPRYNSSPFYYQQNHIQFETQEYEND